MPVLGALPSSLEISCTGFRECLLCAKSALAEQDVATGKPVQSVEDPQLNVLVMIRSAGAGDSLVQAAAAPVAAGSCPGAGACGLRPDPATAPDEAGDAGGSLDPQAMAGSAKCPVSIFSICPWAFNT
jgi:hypothetical protein